MSPFILAMTPFSPEMDLGKAYNTAMALLPEDGWAVFMDHDIMFTTVNWYAQVAEAITRHPTGTFTGVTNRIWNRWQQAAETVRLPDDVAVHRKAGEARVANQTIADVTDQRPGWGGMLIIISKETWHFAGGFREGGMGCVDHLIHQAVAASGRRVYVIHGLYVYHWRGLSHGIPTSARPIVYGCCHQRP